MKIEYKKIQKKKLYEEVTETLHGMIKRGELKPGDKLDAVHKLAEHFQVGRSAIREALSALRAMGLVEMKQGEGTYVRQFDSANVDFSLPSAVLMNKKDVVHLLEVRKIIETGIVKYAAQNRTNEDIKALKKVLKQMKEAKGNEKEEEKTDIDFHFTIAKAAHNPLMLSLMKNVSDMMKSYMKETRDIWLYTKETTVDDLYLDHARIVDAIIEQKDDIAQEFMWEHLTVVEKNLSSYYRKEQEI